MIRIVLLGPPGAGKGTQAARIAEKFGIPAISTGEIFRSNMAEGTELGLRAKAYIEKGELVPDTVTNPMVAARLGAPDTANGFLLDGYPRSVGQAKVLGQALAKMGIALDAVLEITADEETVVARMKKRAELEKRPDDTEDVIRHRLVVYRETTEPLATYYADNDLLLQVNGDGTVDEVWERIQTALQDLQA